MKLNLRLGLPVLAVGAVLIVAGVLLALRPWAQDATEEAAATPAEYGICNVSFVGIPADVIVGPVPQLAAAFITAAIYVWRRVEHVVHGAA